VSEHSVAERYVLLGLRLGRHIDGLIDGYFGPTELKATVDAEEPAPPRALVEEASSLAEAVETEDLEPQRRRWLAEQVEGLRCVADLVSGVEVPWREAVRRCYGIDAEPMPEERFAEAHERLEAALPGDGDLAGRLQAWNRSQEVPADKMLPAFNALLEELRPRTAGLVELPEGEELSAAVVTGAPWSAYNWYFGNCTSRVDINTDLPFRAYFLAELVAHEGYPGHHTEHACKESRLYRGLGQVETSILLIHTPECLVSEGIAMSAIEQAFGEDWPAEAAEILAPLGVAFDVETTRAVVAAQETMEHIAVNIALYASEEGWSTDEAVAYHQRWGLSEEHRARKSVEFILHEVWGIYVPTYAYGFRLVRAYAKSGEGAFARLLTEQVTTAELLEARV
jgi:hypothetical protein